MTLILAWFLAVLANAGIGVEPLREMPLSAVYSTAERYYKANVDIRVEEPLFSKAYGQNSVDARRESDRQDCPGNTQECEAHGRDSTRKQTAEELAGSGSGSWAEASYDCLYYLSIGGWCLSDEPQVNR